jgi:hypothetical protein
MKHGAMQRYEDCLANQLAPARFVSAQAGARWFRFGAAVLRFGDAGALPFKWLRAMTRIVRCSLKLKGPANKVAATRAWRSR